MLEWIESNKTIIFSGFGTAIVVFILGKIFVTKSGNSQKQKSGNKSTNFQAGGDITLGKSEDK